MTTNETQAAALDDYANLCFLDLIEADEAEIVDCVPVDSGQITVKDPCADEPRARITTACGDGIYPVWKGKKYVIIEIDSYNAMRLDKELAELN